MEKEFDDAVKRLGDARERVLREDPTFFNKEESDASRAFRRALIDLFKVHFKYKEMRGE